MRRTADVAALELARWLACVAFEGPVDMRHFVKARLPGNVSGWLIGVDLQPSGLQHHLLIYSPFVSFTVGQLSLAFLIRLSRSLLHMVFTFGL